MSELDYDKIAKILGGTVRKIPHTHFGQMSGPALEQLQLPRIQSRQDVWRRKQRAKGNCVSCGKPRNQDKNYCDVCRDRANAKRREKYAREKNRVKHG